MTTAKKSTHMYISNPFKLVFEGLELFFKYNQTMAIIIIVFGLFGMVGNLWGSPSPGSTNSSAVVSSTPEPGAILMIGIIIFVVLLIVLPIVVFISTMYSGMVAYTIVQTSYGKTVSINEALTAALKKFWVILWTQIIVILKIIGGTLLFIIPGIRAGLRYKMVLLPIFEQNASSKQAIVISKSITKGHLIEVFGMSFAAGIIPIVGPVLDAGGQSIMYPQLKELHSSESTVKPSVHWLNYIGFLVIGLFSLLLSLIIVAIATLAL